MHPKNPPLQHVTLPSVVLNAEYKTVILQKTCFGKPAGALFTSEIQLTDRLIKDIGGNKSNVGDNQVFSVHGDVSQGYWFETIRLMEILTFILLKSKQHT